MALLFQSNPDQWNLRQDFEPGQYVSWFVSRYQAMMYPGALVLLWEAKGSKPQVIKGLYGWGITTGEVRPDSNGKLRVPLQYIERWASRADKTKPLDQHVAPIPAAAVLLLPAWKEHLLAIMPIGTNFLVTGQQLEELSEHIVKVRFSSSQFPKAVELDRKGDRLDPAAFRPQMCYEGEE